MRRGPRAFSKFGGLMLVMTAAGVETGRKIATRLFPLEKITSYIIDESHMQKDFREMRENLDLKTKFGSKIETDSKMRDILGDFEEIQHLR